ncbi:c-type cytochrome [Acidimangrovimonas pyrenivorans]|uniref:C-type cytochrome n=1 Tax=Acidimangrovimonas pyrenivorans TaxID=2030798 RepID=A0ABV7ACV7_9RHOB
MRIFVGLAGVTLVALVAACTGQPPQVAAGRASYQDLCAGCHGVDGRGDGPAAADLKVKPADLTGIAARNDGSFPRIAVMSMIDGYNRAKGHGGMMPVFDTLLEGPKVMIDTGDGVVTPTPEKLVDLADYVETLQR